MPLTHVHRRRQKPKMCLTVRPIGVREDKRDKDGNMMREQSKGEEKPVGREGNTDVYFGTLDNFFFQSKSKNFLQI